MAFSTAIAMIVAIRVAASAERGAGPTPERTAR
jgi:hypothetical protein